MLTKFHNHRVKEIRWIEHEGRQIITIMADKGFAEELVQRIRDEKKTKQDEVPDKKT